MITLKNTVTAQLNQEESELVSKAQEKYKSDGKGKISIRGLLMLGVNYCLTNDNADV